MTFLHNFWIITLMDTSEIQAFPPNVLERKISLNRLKNLQKLSVYGKSPHRQLRRETCILHYGISRQKQIPN